MGGRGLEREGRRKDGREVAFGCRMIMAQADPRRQGCSKEEDRLAILNQSLEMIFTGTRWINLKRPHADY